MTTIRIFLASLIAVFTILVFTVAYLWFYIRTYTPGSKATGIDLLQAWTIRSPVWWTLVVVVLAILWRLLRGWFKSGG